MTSSWMAPRNFVNISLLSTWRQAVNLTNIAVLSIEPLWTNLSLILMKYSDILSWKYMPKRNLQIIGHFLSASIDECV